MSQHYIELADSYVRNFCRLDPCVQAEIHAIHEELARDPYFMPDGDKYLVDEKHKSERVVVCQHVSGWDGWQMVWFFEYSDVMPSTPENIVLMLHYQPFKTIKPVRR